MKYNLNTKKGPDPPASVAFAIDFRSTVSARLLQNLQRDFSARDLEYLHSIHTFRPINRNGIYREYQLLFVWARSLF